MFVMSKLTIVNYWAYIWPIPLPSMQYYYTHKYFLYFYAIIINFKLDVYFIKNIVNVLF